MAKTRNQFKAYDLRRKKISTIPAPLTPIRRHRVDQREWATQPTQATRKVKKRQVVKTTKRSISAAEILREDRFEWQCLHCEKSGDDPECIGRCYEAFCKENFQDHLFEIRGPGPLGYSAFTKPGVEIEKGQWLGEYLGDLRPLDTDKTESMYCFYIPGKCVVDAEQAGNWTRFMNSHCRPNVRVEPEFVGKKRVLFLKALQDIGQEEELFFKYGKNYFKKAGFACKCSACLLPNVTKRKSKKS